MIATSAIETSGAAARHVIFRVEKERYALPLPAVREVVVPPASLTRVPRAPKPVLGVMNLRGRVVTLVSLALLLELPVTSPSGEGRVVLLEKRRRALGLWVTDVESIEPLERISTAATTPSSVLRGVARLKGWAVTVLDPDGVDDAVAALFAARMN